MKNNFTGRYLGIFGNRICDEQGNEINTIKTIKDKNFFFEYKKPRIIYDSLVINKIINEPDIIEIKFSDLESLGLTIVSTKGKIRKGQQVLYNICKKTRIPNNCNVLDTIPQKHHVYFDLANNIIKIEGPNSFGEWVIVDL